MSEMYNVTSNDSQRVAELDRLADKQRRQIDNLNNEKVNLQTKLDEHKITNARLSTQVKYYTSKSLHKFNSNISWMVSLILKTTQHPPPPVPESSKRHTSGMSELSHLVKLWCIRKSIYYLSLVVFKKQKKTHFVLFHEWVVALNPQPLHQVLTQRHDSNLQ